MTNTSQTNSRDGLSPTTKLWLFLTPIVVVLTYLFVTTNHEVIDSHEQANDRAAIKSCWKNHANTPLSPIEQKYVAEACEFMENEFLLKYRSKP
ncbi:hypothetical protein LG201_07420 [Methylobacillus gramineus]|uniref:hypothetical protein n=1 Tax=Methylobacillus gramineus TaxID=755169 RepID=UPI001CFFEC34|nr:hypothetical protein [Methylobacillus gramineus]MCB5185031.1 hypothetical protein [Methylobacillus gramineus]